MNENLGTIANTKERKIVFMLENILKINIEHQAGYTTLHIDVHNIPAELRQKLKDGDSDTLNQLESYFCNYYSDAELDSISLIRGDIYDSNHRWEEIFMCCGFFRRIMIKARRRLIKAAIAL